MKPLYFRAALIFCSALILMALPLHAAPQISALSQARDEAAAGHFDRAAQLFQSVLASSPDNSSALAGLVDALEAMGRWRDSLPALKRLVELQPQNAPRVFQLGQMESWQDGQRATALELLKRAMDLDPQNVKYQEYYAEVLSWNRATRPQALESYKKVLSQEPSNSRALDGEAQLLAWDGRSSQALGIYEQVLRRNPNDVGALRGKAEILSWRGEQAQARNLLLQAHGLAPGDSATTLSLARSEYELGDFAQAREDLALLSDTSSADYQDLQRGVNHALGTYLEFGYGMRRDGMKLDYDSATALVSTPLGASNRITLLYTPSLYRATPRNFSSNVYSVSLDSHLAEQMTTHTEFTERTYPGVPSHTEGSFDAAFHVRPSLKLTTGFVREADLESLVSTLGAATSGVFVGQVETNLGSIAADYSSSRHHYDVSLTYTDGMYTGQNLASNRRWSVDGNIGKSIRGSRPYVRAAYGFTYLHFDHDAEFEPGSGAPARVTGGYFSPTRFLLNYGQLSLSADLGRHAKWDASGFAGAQNAETAFTSFSSTQFASTFSTHLTWGVTDHNDLRLGYDYLNVFNAFHRHLFLVSWRQYF